MTWKELLEKRIVVRHKTAKTQIVEFRGFIRQNLRDALAQSTIVGKPIQHRLSRGDLNRQGRRLLQGYRLKAGRGRYFAFKTLKLAMGSSLKRK